jgi:CBS domain-containing protein
MKVSEAMTRNVCLASPDQTIREAAMEMATHDCGILPVRENDRLVGMITDRDIAVRGIAKGLGPDTKIREVMTHEVKYCFEDDDVEDVAENMAEIQVRRLPVLGQDKRLVGIVSIGDLALECEDLDEIGEALGGISRPGGAHTQNEPRRM